MVFIDTTDVLKVWWSSVGVTMRITGPNDTKHVIWALGEFFCVLLLFLLYLLLYICTTNIIKVQNGTLKAWRRFVADNNEDNGPRRDI